jgi:hypothetical protein
MVTAKGLPEKHAKNRPKNGQKSEQKTREKCHRVSCKCLYLQSLPQRFFDADLRGSAELIVKMGSFNHGLH